jgi:hypothetical protein
MAVDTVPKIFLDFMRDLKDNSVRISYVPRTESQVYQQTCTTEAHFMEPAILLPYVAGVLSPLRNRTRNARH